MRVHTAIATKDHYIFIAKCTSPFAELYSANAYPTGNPIGFLVKGSANAFKKDVPSSPWVYYTDHTGPSLHIRSEKSLFGGVSTCDDLLYISILPREDVLIGEWKNLVESHASLDDIDKIQNSNATFQISNQCTYELYRSLGTFEILDHDPNELLFSEDEFIIDGI